MIESPRKGIIQGQNPSRSDFVVQMERRKGLSAAENIGGKMICLSMGDG